MSPGTPLGEGDGEGPLKLGDDGVRSPMEAHAGFRGECWSPERLAFHQNLETFAERVGLIVALQGNGKISQEEAYAQIKHIWKALKQSKGHLIDGGV
ncbi:MAG: hypothetical protein VKN56_07865 [Cyanobacteriota bacterium]|nr:hypothetical protein [Cyanobacteriota bacterium]